MNIIASIYIKNNKTVRVKSGDFRTLKIYDDSPVDLFKKFEDVVKRAGSLLLPNTIASVTNCVFAVRCPTPVMANVWWASQWKKSSDKKEKLEMERRAVLWFNSTLGLLSIVSLMGAFTGGAYLKPSKDWWQTQAKMIDLSSLPTIFPHYWAFSGIGSPNIFRDKNSSSRVC